MTERYITPELSVCAFNTENGFAASEEKSLGATNNYFDYNDDDKFVW